MKTRNSHVWIFVISGFVVSCDRRCVRQPEVVSGDHFAESYRLVVDELNWAVVDTLTV